MRVQVVVIVLTSLSIWDDNFSFFRALYTAGNFLQSVRMVKVEVGWGGGARGSEILRMFVPASSSCLCFLEEAGAAHAETCMCINRTTLADELEMAGNFGWMFEDVPMMDEKGGGRDECSRREQFRRSPR